jgi:hypothetical protein
MNITKPKAIAGIVGGLIVLGCSGAGGVANGDKSPPSTTPTEQITLAEFDSITHGMTFDEVVVIVGSPGKVSSEIMNTKTYTFDGGIMASGIIQFTDGKVSSKSHFGLK